MKRVLFSIIFLLVSILLLSGCVKQQQPQVSPAAPQATSPTVSTSDTNDIGNLREFTLEELAQYNGQDGKPAYVAVKGIVYDVTNAKLWQAGKHIPFGPQVIAGKDLTEEISKAPPSHQTPEHWAKIPKVGTLKSTQ